MKNQEAHNSDTPKRKSFGFNRKSVRRLMNELSITPPARVWSKIEKMLDKQDAAAKQQEMKAAAAKTRKKNYMDYAAAVLVLASLLKLLK